MGAVFLSLEITFCVAEKFQASCTGMWSTCHELMSSMLNNIINDILAGQNINLNIKQ